MEGEQEEDGLPPGVGTEWVDDDTLDRTRKENKEEDETALDLPRAPRLDLDDFAEPAPPRTSVLDDPGALAVPASRPPPVPAPVRRKVWATPSSQFERFGKYALLSSVGHGGMAEVRLAMGPTPTSDNAPCVIKRISQEFADREDFLAMFREETRIALRLNHPLIVRAFDAGQTDGVPYIVFELIDGVSLQELKRVHGGPLPVSVVLEAACGIAMALAYAHAIKDDTGTPLHLVHRDVSPDNVLVARSGGVRLVDFGIARFRGREHHTLHGQVKGKLRFMAPEQLLRTGVDQRTDLYSLGLVMAEALGLLQPNTLQIVLSQVANEALDVPEEVHGLLLLLTRENKEDRPPDAATVMSILNDLMRRLPGPKLDDFAAELVFAKRPPMIPRPAQAPRTPTQDPPPMGPKYQGLIEDLIAFEDEVSDSYATILRNLSRQWHRTQDGLESTDDSSPSLSGDLEPPESTPVFEAGWVAVALAQGAGLQDRPSNSIPPQSPRPAGATRHERAKPFGDGLEAPTVRPGDLALVAKPLEAPLNLARPGPGAPALGGMLAEASAKPLRRPPPRPTVSWAAVIAIVCLALAIVALLLAGLVLAGKL
ncbi:MAG: serine/threonine-protein kinase [Myxococcota bacterium]